MEENLKVLEEMLERKKECLHYDIYQNEVQAIENLIKGYKELEEELEQRIEQKVEDYRYVDKEMIPKSKVREKIDILNTNIVNAERFDGDYECVPEVAEQRIDGKWYTTEREIPFEVKYFFDMQELLEERN